MKNKLHKSMLLVMSALGIGACGPVAPTNPTWEHDVHPFLVARCLRCHDDPGRIDPLTGGVAPPASAYNFNYATLPSPLPAGLAILQGLGPNSLRGTGVPRRMPPEPAEAAEDWQIDMLANWALNPR